MGFIVIKLAVVTSRKCITDFAEIPKLALITTEMLLIKDVVVFVAINYFIHTHILPYGFLKTLSEPDFKKRPPTPHKNLWWFRELDSDICRHRHLKFPPHGFPREYDTLFPWINVLESIGLPMGESVDLP